MIGQAEPRMSGSPPPARASSASVTAAWVAWVALSVAQAVAPERSSAQGPPGSDTLALATESSPAPLDTGGWGAYAISPHPWTTVVALTVALPVGSSLDPPGRDGTAWLLAQTVRSEIAERSGEAVLRVDVQVERTRTVYQVLASPTRWDDVLSDLTGSLFSSGPPSSSFELVRDSLRSLLSFEAGTPIREYERALNLLLSDGDVDWSGPIRGTPETVDAILLEEVEAYRNAHYDRASAALTVTGPVIGPQAQSLVLGLPSGPSTQTPSADSDTSADSSANPTATVVFAAGALPGRPLAAAWSAGERVRISPEVTSAWIAAAYPVDPAAERMGLEFVAHRVRELLVTEPPAPGLFSADIDLLELAGGELLLLIRTAVLPGSMAAWERRVLGALDRVRTEELEGGFLRAHLRRFRNQRLLQDASPEAHGLRLVLDLLREGRVRDLDQEIRALRPEQVRTALDALGSPRILVFGPDLRSQGSSRDELDGPEGG